MKLSLLGDVCDVIGGGTPSKKQKQYYGGDIPWAHIDLMAYNTRARPGRPEGGEAQAIRGLYAMLKAKFG